MAEDNTAPTLESAEETQANCAGELRQIPSMPGVTSYVCLTCGQLVHVGREQLAANGLPSEHALATA